MSKCPECEKEMVKVPNKKGGGFTLKHKDGERGDCSITFIPVREKKNGGKEGTERPATQETYTEAVRKDKRKSGAGNKPERRQAHAAAAGSHEQPAAASGGNKDRQPKGKSYDEYIKGIVG